MQEKLERTLVNARRTLLAERIAEGHWEGELSTSALSTATAIVALHSVDSEKHRDAILAGASWLVEHQNEDGGWGDTVLSFSNISTTLLCWSALSRISPNSNEAIKNAEKWIEDYAGSTAPEAIVRKVVERYGKDRTFAVPILMMCAICGRLGEEGWKRVLPLPFELAAFPREWFAALRLPVVSYALPALIAIGYARFYNAPPLFPWSWIRRKIWPKTSSLLAQIQPASGGFLEAAPLTSFVTMALANADQTDHPVVENGVRFLLDSLREDGSWPIDTNLATWGTTLATKALTRAPDREDFSREDRERVLSWIVNQQYEEIHPFTNAALGGWAWTDLSGGVPDADDTPGALLVLHAMVDKPDAEVIQRVEKGITWLLDLQNGDGGIPTFCRGWGTLPFDRSSPDLTAHTLRACNVWKDEIDGVLRARLDRAMEFAVRYLAREQKADGSWLPLWFGNQHVDDETNRTYGTAMVLLALAEIEGWEPSAKALRPAAIQWLTANQNSDGGWGGQSGAPSSIEETALAVDALASLSDAERPAENIAGGVEFLCSATKEGTDFPPAPIGFYFAKLWYYEKLYPMVWTVSALENARTVVSESISDAR